MHAWEGATQTSLGGGPHDIGSSMTVRTRHDGGRLGVDEEAPRAYRPHVELKRSILA